jgi:hypothetical protein
MPGLLPMDFGVLPRQAVDAQQSHIGMSKPLSSLSSDPSIPLVCRPGQRGRSLAPKLTSAPSAFRHVRKPWHGSPLCIFSSGYHGYSRATQIFNMSLCSIILYRRLGYIGSLWWWMISRPGYLIDWIIYEILPVILCMQVQFGMFRMPLWWMRIYIIEWFLASIGIFW